MTEQVPPAGPPDVAPQHELVGAQGDSAPLASRGRALAAAANAAAGSSAVAGRDFDRADVIVVGAGPAGSAVAYYLATAGLDVLMLEKIQLPAGEGLRRRADPARGQGADRHGRADRRGRRLAAQQGPADHRRRRPDRAGLARPVQLSRLRPGPDPDRTSTRSWPGTPRRRAPGCYEGVNVTGPVLDDRTGPDHRRHRAGTAAADVSVGAGSSSPRTATRPGCRSRWACTSGTTGRSASRCGPTTPRPGMTTTTSRPGWTCGTANRCCPATAGSSGWATAPPTWASAC